VPLLDADLEHYPKKFGKYQLLGPLAQGGMGALYLAVGGDRGLERLMVIKTILPHLADAEYVARFRDEAKVVVKLSHGNLIPVFDAGVVGGELFLAMDFVEGRDLRAVWNRCAKKQVAFPIDVAVYIVKELCRGLGYAHAFPDLHLVHRDISPPNILLSYTGEVKLTDFGLASSSLKLEKTVPGIIYGKVAYMSPEQARGEKLDGRSDMYAAAIVLWELLTGRQLYPPGKDQPLDLLTRAKNPEPPRPSKRAPRVPSELDEICLRALSPSRDDRYPDCDAMRMALQSWLAQAAPTTDGSRMSSFLAELFVDDIQRERAERNELINRVRTRALTLPPTDELRMIVEAGSAGLAAARSTPGSDLLAQGSAPGHEPPVRKPGSVGRRASDRLDESIDRRQAPDRRNIATRPAATTSAADRSGSAAALATQVEADLAEPDLIGSEVDGRYRVLELIGEGGMGKVYLAEHVEIGKRVALKVLHPSYSRMPDLVERFRREARAASKIGHPNIVDVTDSGTTADGSVYFVMEYLEGVELGSVIEREGALDVARALKITGQICRALAAAHREGIIHRDLKPENIFLITRDGTADVVKVLDFGIAKTTEAEAARERRLTSPGMAMGTPEYMSPEQAAGRAADARCDVYALGAIMYEMVTGIPPYSGENFMEILTKKATQDPLPPSLQRAELPGAVSDLVVAAMARSPSDRPQTMEALEYELNKCLAGRGVAVAQILGMTTDPHVVATLNPGLSIRQLDDAAVVSRPQTSSPAIGLPRPGTHSGMSELPGAWSGPIVATGQNQLMVRAISEPSVSASYPGQSMQLRAQSSPAIQTPASSDHAMLLSQPAFALRRSALGVFGWLVLAAVLFGGIGSLLYIALGERNAASKAVGAREAAGSSGPVKVNVVLPPPESGSDQAQQLGSAGTPQAPQAAVPEPDAVTSSGPLVDDTRPDPNRVGTVKMPLEDADDAAEKPGEKPGEKPNDKAAPKGQERPGQKKAPVRVAAVKRPTAPTEEPRPKDFAAQIKRAQAFEKAGQWNDARAVYKKLERVRGYSAESLYRQAYAAFQAKSSDTVQLATEAAKPEGPFQKAALMLYGDALFRVDEFERAKSIYTNVRERVKGDDRVALARKIAACNKRLRLPERDGIVGD
jgi:serine/threonine protein kinase